MNLTYHVGPKNEIRRRFFEQPMYRRDADWIERIGPIQMSCLYPSMIRRLVYTLFSCDAQINKLGHELHGRFTFLEHLARTSGFTSVR